MSELAADTLAALAQLWRRERVTARLRFEALRADLSVRERIRRGLVLADLFVDEAEPAPGGRTRLWLAGRGQALSSEGMRLRGGDPILLYGNDPTDSDAVRAVVVRWRRGTLGVMIDGDPGEFLEAGGFRLEKAAPEATFDRGERALAAARSARASSDLGRLREVGWGSAPLDPRGPDRPLRIFDAALNPPQVAAVQAAMSTTPIALIHGPPGTGKTRTLCEVVRQAVAHGEKVLVTAASNVAVDNLAERLVAAGVDVIRLGHPARVLPAVSAHTLDAALESSEIRRLAERWIAEANSLRARANRRFARGAITHRERRELMRQAHGLYRDARKQLQLAQQAILARAPVICSTAAGADAQAVSGIAFDLVVLDEATQATDPIALVALQRGARAVLAGDPRQLPPTVIDPEAQRLGLGTTVFERLAARLGDSALSMLTIQYRMNIELMTFPSAASYGGRLVAAEDVARRRLHELAGVRPDPLRPVPLIFVDAAGKGWDEVRADDDPSTANPGFAERAALEVERLVTRGLEPSDCALITPYDAQVRAHLARLAELVAAGLEIGTVDGFQGREKEVIVCDLVRSNDSATLGFVADVRRMNVALTRARRAMIIVGDSATLGGNEYFGALMNAVESQGGWLSAWSDDAPPLQGDDSPA